MGRPSQADILAHQLGSAGRSMNRSPASSPEIPWLSDSHSSSAASSPEVSRTQSSFKPREAVSRKLFDEDEEDDDEYIGYGKPKRTGKKESLMDLLSSDPPWAHEDSAPPPPPLQPKQSFGKKLLGRRRMGSTPAIPVESGTADSSSFRRTGTTRSQGSGPLRSTKSSTSLPARNFDDFALSLSPQTRKLYPKIEGTREDTGDLAAFLRSSEPPASSIRAASSHRRPSTTASIDTTSSSRARVGPALRDDDRETLASPGSAHAYGVWSSGGWDNTGAGLPTYETISPSASLRRTENPYGGSRPAVASDSLVRSSSLARSGSLSPGSYRKSPRKPVPSPDDLPEVSSAPSSSMSYISQSTLAMIMGEDATEPVSLPPPHRRPSPPRPTAAPAAEASRVHQSSASSTDEPVKFRERIVLRETATQTTPPRAKEINRPPPFKLTRRPATADDALPSSGSSSNEDSATRSQRTRFHTSSSQGSQTSNSSDRLEPRSLSPSFITRRPISPPPVAPLPAPPGRPRPMSIAIQPAAAAPLDLSAMHPDEDGRPEVWQRSRSRPSSTDSAMDPPLSRASHRESYASTRTLISSRDPIFVALRVLQQTMRTGGSLSIPPSIFSSDEDDPNAGLTRGQLSALVPSLAALHGQMSSAANLLEIVLQRAKAVNSADRDEDAQDAAAVDFLLGGGDAPLTRSPASHSGSSDSGIGLGIGVEKEAEGSSTDDDGFPLLVKHLSVQQI